MKTVADLQPGDIVNISDQPFTVKSVYNIWRQHNAGFRGCTRHTGKVRRSQRACQRYGRHCCDGAGTPDAEAIVGAI